MARKIYQYQPINETPDQPIGILLPMNKASDRFDRSLTAISGSSLGQQYDGKRGSGTGVFAVSYSTEEQAISNLINLLLTDLGERYMQPTFGTRIRQATFQQNTVQLSNFIETTIKEAVQKWLPYIEIRGVNINREVDQYSIAIQVIFRVSTKGANLVINILADENRVMLIDISEIDAETELTLVEVGTFGDTFAAGTY